LKGNEMSRVRFNLVVVFVSIVLIFVSGCSMGGSSSINEFGLFSLNDEGARVFYIEGVDSSLSISNNSQTVEAITAQTEARSNNKNETKIATRRIATKKKLIESAMKKRVINNSEEFINSMGF
jgi:hypothetical protein